MLPSIEDPDDDDDDDDDDNEDDTDDEYHGTLPSVAKQSGPSVEPALLTQNFHLSKV